MAPQEVSFAKHAGQQKSPDCSGDIANNGLVSTGFANPSTILKNILPV
jgi:hypothetical protein